MKQHVFMLAVVLCFFLLPIVGDAQDMLVTPGADVFRFNLDSRDAWRAQPSWLPNHDPNASVERTAEGLRFTVPAPNRGMKWSTTIPSIYIAEQRFLLLRYKGLNIDTKKTDYVVHLNDGLEKQFNAMLLSELQTDDQWRVLVVYLPSRTKADTVFGTAAVQVQANGAGNASLVISDLILTDAVAERYLSPALKAEIERFEGTPNEGFRLTFATVQGWREQPTWFQQDLAGKASLCCEGNIAHFSVQGAARSRMKWSFNLPSPLETTPFPFVAMRYKARNLGHTNDYALFIGGSTEGKINLGGPVLFASELECDGVWHTAVGRVPPHVRCAREIAIQVEVGKSGQADLWIESIAFTDRPVKAQNDMPDFKAGHPTDASDFKTIDLPDGGLNAATIQKAANLRAWFPEQNITIGTIPFKIGLGDKAGLGTPLRGSDSRVSVPLAGKASEVWLLLAAKFRGVDEPGFGGPRPTPRKDRRTSPITSMCEPIRVCIELVHEDGSDFAVPVNVQRQEHIVTRGLGLYCIPTRLRGELKQLILHDDTDLGAFYIVGVTLNLSEMRRLEGFERDAPAVALRPIVPPAPSRPVIHVEGKQFTLQSAAYRYQFDTASGLRLLSARNEMIDSPVCVRPAEFNLFAVQVGKQSIPCTEFRALTPPRLLGGDTVEISFESPSSLAEARLVATLRLKAEQREILCSLSIKNAGNSETRPTVFFPDLSGLGVGSVAHTYYFYPKLGAAFGKVPCSLRHPHSGAFPFQFMDIYNPLLGGGVYLRTLDINLNWKWFILWKQEDGMRLAVEYLDQPIAPGQERVFPDAALGMHVGDWHAALGAYRDWLATWYKPLASRPRWFREVFNFRQEFLYFITTKLFDSKTKRFDILGEIADVKEQFGGCDYMHIFDWGYTKQFGRCGDYNHWEDMGGLENFRKAINTAQEAGVPVGLYIEGYLVSPPSNLGKTHGTEWQLLDAQDKPYPYFPPDYNMCPNVKGWQDYLASTYKRVAQETGAKGFYIDEFGFANQGHFCYNKAHGHEIPAPPLRGEMELTRKVRTALNEVSPDIVLYTEESPCDVTSQYQDGSFTYALCSYRKPPDVLSLYRFVIPDFKLFEIIVCDAPIGGNYEAVRRVFFNGNGLWIEGRADEWFTDKTRAEIARLYRVLRTHKDAFTSMRPVPLVPTLKEGVLANEFPSDTQSKTVYTFFNTNYWSVGGDIISLPHRQGSRYLDAFSGAELQPVLINGHAIIQMEIKPRDVACLLVATPTIQ